MASTIAAITTGTGGVVTTADSSGNLSLLSGATTVVAVTSTGAKVSTGSLTGSYGTGGITSNFAAGDGALNANTSGNFNIALGYNSLSSNTTGTQNTAVGYQALTFNVSGSSNIAIGHNTLAYNTASNNTAVGYQAMLGASGTSTGAINAAFGYQAGYANTTGTEGVFIGSTAGYSNTTGATNTAVGVGALYTNTTSSNNAVFGGGAGYISTGGSNTFIGASAGANATTGAGNVCVGYIAGNSAAVLALTTQSNRIVMGNQNITNAYVLVAWTVTSDARDKTDIISAPYGLNFVNELRPVTYKWDKRCNYENSIPDGTHKEPKTQLGFLAQDVIELEKKYGGIAGDLLVADDESEESLKITETKMIPVLVKAIQELKAEFDAYKATHP